MTWEELDGKTIGIVFRGSHGTADRRWTFYIAKDDEFVNVTELLNEVWQAPLWGDEISLPAVSAETMYRLCEARGVKLKWVWL